MRILIPTFGSRGELQPLLALATGLRSFGHRVTIAAAPNFRTWVSEHGFAFEGVGSDMEKLLQCVGSDVGAGFQALQAEIGVQFAQLHGPAASADLILAGSLSFASDSIAEALGIPHRRVFFCPQRLPSRFHAPPESRWQGIPRWLHRAAWWGAARRRDRFFLGEVNRGRANLGLPPQDHVFQRSTWEQSILACDPALASSPPDSNCAVHQTGALMLPETQMLDTATEAFLLSGPPPVFIGFGSTPEGDPVANTRLIVEAVQMAGVRAILSSGCVGPGAADLPPAIHRIGAAPEEKLFRRVAAVVHHGGAGTTHAAARAGVPQVIVPHFLEQFYWAERTRQLGISAASIPRRRLTAPALANAIRVAVADTQLLDRARALCRTMVRDGVDRAIRALAPATQRLVVPSKRIDEHGMAAYDAAGWSAGAPRPGGALSSGVTPG